MNQSRWGLNFICDAPNFNYDKARNIISLLRPDWIVVINGLSFAKEITVKYPQTNVIVRWVGADNDSRKAWPQPSDFIKWANQEFGGARLWANVSNENGFSGDMLKYWNDVIDQSGDLRLAVGGLSVGTPEPQDWRWPLALDFLKRLDQHRNHVVLSLHEYYPVLPVGGMEGIQLQPNPAVWPQDISGITCWLAGRYQFLIRACQQLEIGVPRIVITEAGTDRIDQFKTWQDSLIKTPPYTEIRGWRTLTNYYRSSYNKDAEWVLVDHARYQDKATYYHPAIEGICPFADCSPESQWGDFHLGNADIFIQGLVDMANDSGPKPEEQPQVNEPILGEYNRVIVPTDLGHVNLRSEPDSHSLDLGDVITGDVLYVYAGSRRSANGNIWVRVDHWRGGEKRNTGYMAVLPGVIYEKADKPELPATFDARQAYVNLLQAEICYHDAAIKNHQAQINLLLKMAESLNPQTHELKLENVA